MLDPDMLSRTGQSTRFGIDVPEVEDHPAGEDHGEDDGRACIENAFNGEYPRPDDDTSRRSRT